MRRRKSREARPHGSRRWHNRYSKSPVSRQPPLKVPTVPPPRLRLRSRRWASSRPRRSSSRSSPSGCEPGWLTSPCCDAISARSSIRSGPPPTRGKSPRPEDRCGVRALVPRPRVEGVKRAQGLPVRDDEQVDVARQRYIKRKAAPKLAGGHAQYGAQVSPEALG